MQRNSEINQTYKKDNGIEGTAASQKRISRMEEEK